MKKILLEFHVMLKHQHHTNENGFQKTIDNADVSGANDQKNGSIGS